MTLDENEIKELIQLKEECEKKKNLIINKKAEISAKKKECNELLKELGYSGLSEYKTKFKPEMDELEDKLIKQKKDMQEYVTYVDEVTEKMHNIVIGE